MSRMVSSPRHLTRPQSGVAPVHEQLARNIGHERARGGRLRGEELLGRRGLEIIEKAEAAPHCWHRPVPCLARRTAAALLRPLRLRARAPVPPQGSPCTHALDASMHPCMQAAAERATVPVQL
jgi:hypothetical protein